MQDVRQGEAMTSDSKLDPNRQWEYDLEDRQAAARTSKERLSPEKLAEFRELVKFGSHLGVGGRALALLLDEIEACWAERKPDETTQKPIKWAGTDEELRQVLREFNEGKLTAERFEQWLKGSPVESRCICPVKSGDLCPVHHTVEPTAKSNDAVRWICPVCTTVNSNNDERCCVGSCAGRRPEKANCQHDLQKPHSTIEVDGERNGKCTVCKTVWNI